jgi:hypothetical protein
MAKILRFRSLKHGRPERMKVLAEDLPRRRRDVWLRTVATGLLLAGAAALAVVAVLTVVT